MTKYDLFRISSDFKRLCCERFRKNTDKGVSCDESCPLLKVSKELKKTVIGIRYDFSNCKWEYEYVVDEIEVKRCVYDVDGDSSVVAIANEEAEDKPETKEENK